MEENEEKIIDDGKIEEGQIRKKKEKKYAALIVSLFSLVFTGTIAFPIIGSLSSKISPSKKSVPSFSWDNQTPGVYGQNKLFKTNENVFSLSKNDNDVSIEEINISAGDAYLVMPTKIYTSETETMNVMSIAGKETNIFSSSSINELEGIYFPSLYTSIGENSFANMSSLKEVKFGSGTGAQKLGDGAFKNATSLLKVTFSKNLTSIGQSSFLNNSSLQELDLTQTSIKTIGENAFEGCVSLSSFALPSSITSIPKELFKGCSSLVSITYKGSKNAWVNLNKDSAWNEGSSLNKVICSDGEIQLNMDF